MQLESLRELAIELLDRLPLRRSHPPMTQAERLARQAAHAAQVAQLAQEIVKYRVMMDIPGDILIGVREISTRFSEAPRDVIEAFLLLQAKGIAHPSEIKDRWVLRS
jgi:hypothetical protein